MNIGFRMGILDMVVIFYTTTIGSQFSEHCEFQDPTQYNFIRGALLNFATVHCFHSLIVQRKFQFFFFLWMNKVWRIVMCMFRHLGLLFNAYSKICIIFTKTNIHYSVTYYLALNDSTEKIITQLFCQNLTKDKVQDNNEETKYSTTLFSVN